MARPQVLGAPLWFKKAHSPTDIIWEHVVQKNFWKKHSLAVLALFLLLLGSFIVVYQISTWEQAISDMFPAVDCNFVKEMYGNKLRRFALEDFDRLYSAEASHSHGAYQCYCEQQLKTNYQTALNSDHGHEDGI